MSFLESDRFPEFECQVDGLTFAYVRNPERHGTPPILMVHGAVVSHLYFLPAADLLADKFDVIIPDLIGHGHSSKPPHAVPVKEQARLLKRFLETLEIPKIVLLANSYGCEIATEFVNEFLHMVDRLILISPASDPHEKNIFKQLIRLFKDGSVENSKMNAVLFRDVSLMNLRRAIETAHIMINFDYRLHLPGIKAKTLVIAGSKDPIAPPKWVEEAASLIPGAKFVVVEGAPHNVQFSTPKPLAELVTKFIEEPI